MLFIIIISIAISDKNNKIMNKIKIMIMHIISIALCFLKNKITIITFIFIYN
jgi:hypothetical protein